MAIQTQKYLRKTIPVDAVRVTLDKMGELSEMVKGKDTHTDKGVRYIDVPVNNALNDRQRMAFVGDWLLFANGGYKVYTDQAFRKFFEPAFEEPKNPPRISSEAAEAMKKIVGDRDEAMKKTVSDAAEETNTEI